MTLASTIFIPENPSRMSVRADAKYHAQECHRSMGHGRMRTRLLIRAVLLSFLTALFVAGVARAEDGHEGWLRYAPLDAAALKTYASLPHVVRVEGDSVVLRSAREELSRGLHGMLGITVAAQAAGAPAIVL